MCAITNLSFLASLMLCFDAHYQIEWKFLAANHFYWGNTMLFSFYDRYEICVCNEAVKFSFKILGAHSCKVCLDKEHF